MDVLKCNHCSGSLRPIAAIKDRDSIRRYLTHVDIDHMPPPRGPPRFIQPELEFGDWDQVWDQVWDQSSQVHQEG